MRRKKALDLWVVYKKTVWGEEPGPNAVCEQAEWDAMELANPGVNTLIQAGMTNEGEAERLARGTSGAAHPRVAKRAITSWPWEVATVLAGSKDPVAG
jgi:hypothetical protein